MKKSWRLTKALFRLIRLPNLIIIMFTQYLVRYLLLKPLIEQYGVQLRLGELNFLMLSLSVALISAAGYVINDYFDRQTDMVNKPGRLIIGRYINRRVAMFLHIVLNFLAFVLGGYVCFQIKMPEMSLVFLAVIGILWFYSTTYKRQFLIGNLIVSFFGGLVPLMVLLFEAVALKNYYGPMLVLMGVNLKTALAWIGGYSVFAFLMNLNREIVKDLEDYEGDFAFGRNTMPIKWGAELTRWFVTGGILLIIIGVALVNVAFIMNPFSLLYSLVFVVMPLMYVGYLVLTGNTKQTYHQASTGLKVVMLTGVLYIIPAYFFVF